MKKVILVLVVVWLSACASFKSYNPDRLGESDLSRLATEDIGAWLNSGELFTNFNLIYDETGNEVAKAGFWSGINDKVNLKPGVYQVILECTNTNGLSSGIYNFHRINVNMEKGKKYIAYCLMKTKKNKIGLSNIKAMVGFISEESEYEKERKIHQELVESIELDK